MENRFQYCKWFQKVMAVFIDGFFVAAPLVSLFLFASFIPGSFKYAAYLLIITAYLLIIHFCKDRIALVIEKIFEKIEKLDEKTMLVIITLTAVAIKVIFTIFFNYDGTQSGDIKIYNDIAETILQTGNLHTRAISHLYGLALHFVVFRLIHLPLHIGLFLAIYTGIVFNFLSFKKIIGKTKAFFAVMVYLLMPSTAFFTFSPTHEVFVFLYISVFLYFFNRFLDEKDIKKTVLDLLFMVVSTVLTCFVNPGGYIIYIIMILAILISNLKISKKALIALALVLSILSSNGISRFLEIDEYVTTMNTYTILIHGVNPNVLGEQEDGYPLKQMRMYIHENTLDFSHEGFIDAAKHVLIEHYIYLLKHPVTLIRLIVHKIYILWSGVHYPIELAHFYDAVDGLVYYGFLGISALIYLFMITIGLVYYRKKEDLMLISNYKLELLGVIALTMFCIVVNKYSVYVTLFIYMISLYRAELHHES
ncbi:MAG: hypothetical protein IJI46_04865 [Erysipelotrichaceae bacterium]|nr:hypothetical protein [Erysipelotrichaceae bacterium]